MTRYYLKAILFITLAFTVNNAFGDPGARPVLRFSPLPMESPQKVMLQFKPMWLYLEQQLGVEIQVEYVHDYGELLQKMQDGQIDFAYLGPLPYVTLKNRFDAAVPLVHFKEADGSPFYTCSLIMTKQTKDNLKALKGKRIALTQPLSTCGYLSTNFLLQETAGISMEDTKYRYVDRHDEVALSVVRGDFEAGGIKSAIGTKYEGLGLMMAGKTQPLPGFGLVVNSVTVPKPLIDRMRDAMINVPEETYKVWGDNIHDGVVSAKDSDYDVVREMLKHIRHIPEKGNF